MGLRDVTGIGNEAGWGVSPDDPPEPAAVEHQRLAVAAARLVYEEHGEFVVAHGHRELLLSWAAVPGASRSVRHHVL
jgi:hypothetical protein